MGVYSGFVADDSCLLFYSYLNCVIYGRFSENQLITGGHLAIDEPNDQHCCIYNGKYHRDCALRDEMDMFFLFCSVGMDT